MIGDEITMNARWIESGGATRIGSSRRKEQIGDWTLLHFYAIMHVHSTYLET
jgi:hypothetical protein